MNLEDIIISDQFTKYSPHFSKIKKCYQIYKRHKTWDRDIVINRNNVLLDGYVKYLLCKMFDIKVVDVNIRAQ